MDNKIKITVSFLIGLCFLSSCAFDGDITFNEIKVNDWAKITYWLEKDNDSTKISSFRLFWTDENLIIDKKYAIKDYDIYNEIEQNSQIIIYTNDLILLKDAGGNNSAFSEQYRKFYLVTPRVSQEEKEDHSFSKQEISRQEFDSIASKCNDCKVIDLQLLREFIASRDKELKPKSVK